MITNEYGMANIQKELLCFIKQFDGLCRKNNIQYTLHGGTLLGAIREKGFIPWDDDIDIGITREQYEKLKELILTDKGKGVYLDCNRDKIKKIWLKGNENVWIDIFIYDFISEKKSVQSLKILGLKLLSAFTKSKITMSAFRINNRAKGLSKFVYEIIYIISKPFPLEYRIKKFDKFCKYAFIGKKQYIHRSNDQLWAMPMIIPVNYMTEFAYVNFEDTELMISTHYDAILTQLYGSNYMTPKKVTEKAQAVHNITRKNIKDKEQI